jgi:hypothetical protein
MVGEARVGERAKEKRRGTRQPTFEVEITKEVISLSI